MFLYHLLGRPIFLDFADVYHKLSFLGVSCFFGLGVTCLFLPMNHYAGKVVVGAQENLMKARDERVALMNEILGAIRMLKVASYSISSDAVSCILFSSWPGNAALKKESSLSGKRSFNIKNLTTPSRPYGTLSGNVANS